MQISKSRNEIDMRVWILFYCAVTFIHLIGISFSLYCRDLVIGQWMVKIFFLLSYMEVTALLVIYQFWWKRDWKSNNDEASIRIKTLWNYRKIYVNRKYSTYTFIYFVAWSTNKSLWNRYSLIREMFTKKIESDPYL